MAVSTIVVAREAWVTAYADRRRRRRWLANSVAVFTPLASLGSLRSLASSFALQYSVASLSFAALAAALTTLALALATLASSLALATLALGFAYLVTVFMWRVYWWWWRRRVHGVAYDFTCLSTSLAALATLASSLALATLAIGGADFVAVRGRWWWRRAFSVAFFVAVIATLGSLTSSLALALALRRWADRLACFHTLLGWVGV
jgi:hypothetical protein